MKLHFDHALVARLLAHAEAATEHSPTLEQLYDPAFLKAGVTTQDPAPSDIDGTKVPAGLMLVGDQGIYLMSNGCPALPDENGRANLVAYAIEADPEKHPDDWYEVKAAAFGGDDGAEFLGADAIRKALEATAGGRFWMNVSPSRISTPYLAPRPKPKRARPGLCKTSA